MGDEWTEVTIRGVVIDPMTGEPTVLLEDNDESAIIAVAADPSITGAIISELEGIEQERAHSLLYRFFIRHTVRVSRVDLSCDPDGNLGASLHYRFDGDDFAMDVRPIDGLLVAVQTHAPIRANDELIFRASTTAAPRVLDGSDLLILSRHQR